MKRNWLAFLVRAIVVIFIFAVVYEAMKKLLNVYPQIKDLYSSDNLIVIVIAWLIIPASVIGIFYRAVTYIRRGLDAPRLNWAKGLDRVGTVIGATILIIFLIIIFVEVVKDTGDIVVASFWAIVFFVIIFVIAATAGWVGDSIDRAFRDRGDVDEDE